MNKFIVAICLLATFQLTASQNNFYEQDTKKCEPITVPMCENMDYNQTSMPNQFNHETQQEAAMEVHQFWALVEINCAAELRFFLCSLYTPICLPNYATPIKACRSVCARARLGCESYMKKFGFEWPEHMNCDLFPEYGSTKEVCMDPMDAYQQEDKNTLHINKEIKSVYKENVVIPIAKQTKAKNVTSNQKNACQSPFIHIKKSDDRYGKLSTGIVNNCIQPCHSVHFDLMQKEFSFYWILTWSIICLFSSLCTALTYLIDSSRFKYPEKPIIFLSICYMFVSAGYLVRFLVGHEKMACENGSIRYGLNSESSSSSISCTISFVLIYYFGMASSVWWIIVSLTWFLAAGLKWGTEAISRYSLFFHLAAWILPFIQTCVILAMSLVDADPLSGICYVGNLSTYNLRMFVIAPALFYLIIGITFLIAGFVSLFRIRKLIKQQHTGDVSRTNKLEKLMLRIGVFSILYTVPATCVIACQFYEQLYRGDWERNALCKRIIFSGNNEIIDEYCSERLKGLSEKPEFSVFILKYLMGLIVGVTSGFWIWTSKSLMAWKIFLNKVFCGFDEKNNSDKCYTTKRQNNGHPRKDSIIYFQANDDLDNNPHNNFFESSSTGGENMPLQHELLTENGMFIQKQGMPISNGSSANGSYKNPESIVSLQFNSTNNTISTSLPYYQAGILKPLQATEKINFQECYPQSAGDFFSNERQMNSHYNIYGVKN